MTDAELRHGPIIVYLGLGSNLGDRQSNLASAIERLSEKASIVSISSVYETDPVGYEEQPRFLNAVLSAETELPPVELLRFIKDIECELGREYSFPNAPRVIDIDILLYGDRVIDSPELTVPHPRLTERAFVLVPLVEISPRTRHPLSDETSADMLTKVGGIEGVRLAGPLRMGREGH